MGKNKKLIEEIFLKLILNIVIFLCCKNPFQLVLINAPVCNHGNQNNFLCGFQEKPKMLLS